MKQMYSVFLGCVVLPSIAFSTAAQAQIEMTCREFDPQPRNPNRELLTNCFEVATMFGLPTRNVNLLVMPNGDVSLQFPTMSGQPRYTCYLKDDKVRLAGPVRQAGDRSCPSLQGGDPGPAGPNVVECNGILMPADDAARVCSPIVFDLGHRGFDLTSVDEGVKFDIDADGVREQVAWTAPGSDDAFLALDRNDNGEIDDGNELFGNVTRLANGETGAHGYIPLGELDLEVNGGNDNGYVDYGDRRFRTLLLWTDRDHDGRSSSAELRPLMDRGIFAIALDADESDVIDEYGNRLAYVSPAYAWRNFRIERIRTSDVFFLYQEVER
jgi:hypothetical protein